MEAGFNAENPPESRGKQRIPGLRGTPRDSGLVWSPETHTVIKFAIFHHRLSETKKVWCQ
jgi:hypothetical protein